MWINKMCVRVFTWLSISVACETVLVNIMIQTSVVIGHSIGPSILTWGTVYAMKWYVYMQLLRKLQLNEDMHHKPNAWYQKGQQSHPPWYTFSLTSIIVTYTEWRRLCNQLYWAVSFFADNITGKWLNGFHEISKKGRTWHTVKICSLWVMLLWYNIFLFLLCGNPCLLPTLWKNQWMDFDIFYDRPDIAVGRIRNMFRMLPLTSWIQD